MSEFKLSGDNGDLNGYQYGGEVRIEIQEHYRESSGHSISLDREKCIELANYLLGVANDNTTKG